MVEPIAFATPEAWNAWLASHHETAREVWILYHKRGSGVASVDWSQAVVEALAYGWIDGIRKTVDDTRWMQRFTPRKAGSAWSTINRKHAERLIAEGRMQAAGLAQVEIARANGRWETTYSGGKIGEMPDEFLQALAAASPLAQQTYASLNSQNRYAIYYRLTTAKRPETRAKRLADFLVKLGQGKPVL